jgi:hypothetical protein
MVLLTPRPWTLQWLLSGQMRHIPYPKLHVFAQALLERQSVGDLQDLVDGMDLSEEWGEEKLKYEDPGD